MSRPECGPRQPSEHGRPRQRRRPVVAQDHQFFTVRVTVLHGVRTLTSKHHLLGPACGPLSASATRRTFHTEICTFHEAIHPLKEVCF